LFSYFLNGVKLPHVSKHFVK